MTLLRNISVRTILATVFVVLALALCGTLGWQLYDGLGPSRERRSARRRSPAPTNGVCRHL